ncbi:MAG: pyruvate carboxylase [Deltaproteobacteria bacterium]|nr:pyruvate carboxylase [Deltaproteobacteria bacterium]
MEIRKFKKIMAANRGEIAIRIFRACTALGINTLAIYSEEDKISLHRYKADEAYQVGRGKGAVDAYLGIDEIIDLARKKGVDAIHPGYGFLSENAEFAEACERAGIAFIGPNADIQRRLGDKVAARKVATSVGVPVVPGTPEPVTSEEEALIFANQCGYPIIIKASAGGGGRGMRVVRNRKELLEGLQSAASEARAAFGNPAVFLEKYIEGPKHVEVQIMGDKHGNVVHFFERDCSVQRRHQKVIEIAPAFYLAPEKRQQLCENALKIAKAVNYINAGTVEFLLDKDQNFYFIETNPRIQVEHTVTELITGRNLVEIQIRVAEGHRLSDPEIGIAQQSDISLRGNAIQCRISTEDPENNFSPNFGTIESYRSGSGPGVRLDAGNAYAGARITPYYDSLLVKVSTYGLNFREAAAHMNRVLIEFRVRGVKTNIGFLRNVINHPDFLNGVCTTAFLDQHPELFNIAPRRDRSTRMLSFIGHTVVNGYPGIKKPLHFKDLREPEMPDIRYGEPLPKGTRDILLERGPKGLADWMLEQKRLLICDTTMRDAHQSLLATRIRSYDLLRIADATARIGSNLYSLECWGGATFDVAMRFLNECPWERLQKLRRKIPNVLFQMLLRGPNAVGYANYPDNVIDRFVQLSAENGIDIFRVFDALNWTTGLRPAMEAVLKHGGVLEASMCYTGDILDPKRDKYPLKYYVDLGKELERMGAHILNIKDMAGLLKPFAAEKLIRALKDEISIPISLHTHDTSSAGVATLMMASRAGVDSVDAAISSLSGLTAQPSLNALLAALNNTERDPGLDRDGLQQIANYWETVRTYYAPFESELRSGTAQVYEHEIPGGQYSNYRPQVEGMGLGDKWEECKRMYRRVNYMFGDVIKVTPVSKIVGDMAIFMVKNNLTPEDIYERGSEIDLPHGVVEFFRGMIGQPYGGFPKKLQEIVLKGEKPITHRPGELLEPVDFAASKAALEKKLGHKVSELDHMSWLMYPRVFEDFDRHRQNYLDTSVMSTPLFFYGLDIMDEASVTVEEGKDLVVKLMAVGRIEEGGVRTIYFELNGEPRQLVVRDLSIEVEQVENRKADPCDARQIGAPMPGRICKLFVDVGDKVEADDTLLVTEAMKMETNVKTPIAGVVRDILHKEGAQLQQGDLVVILE